MTWEGTFPILTLVGPSIAAKDLACAALSLRISDQLSVRPTITTFLLGQRQRGGGAGCAPKTNARLEFSEQGNTVLHIACHANSVTRNVLILPSTSTIDSTKQRKLSRP